MRDSTRDLQRTVLEGKHKRRSRARRPAVEGLEERALLSAAHDLAVHKHFAVPDDRTADYYEVTNLVSDIRGKAQLYDPSLVDPWDINFPQLPGIDPPVWVADEGTGVVTMYQIEGSTVTRSPFTVTIPTVPQLILKQTGPTGVVYDPLKKFSMPGGVSATYIFDTLQGAIEGYNVPKPSNSTSGVVRSPAEILVKPTPYNTTEYTGLAIGEYNGEYYIYAANDIASPGIDVYNSSFQPVPFLPGSTFTPDFFDPDLPPGSGFTPYGVHDLGKMLIVTYRGPNFSGGAVAEFTNGGTFVKQIAYNGVLGPLQSPWGVAEFKNTSKDIFVGNFSSGQIDRYNVKSGQFEGTLDDKYGNPLTIPGLRTIHFGPGPGASGQTNAAILFTAGPNDGKDGLYGTINRVTRIPHRKVP